MSLINKWFGFDNKETKTNTDIYDGHNLILFSIGDTGDINLDILIKHKTDASAKQLGTFLYDLTSHLYSLSITDTLVKMSDTQPEYSTFVAQTLGTWSRLMNQKTEHLNNTNKDDPIINPSDFGTLKS